MRYIALQLVGIESVTVMGIGSTSGNAFIRDLPLIIAFGVVAACTYPAGLRAPALIAFVKDILIYVTVIVAMLYIPWPNGTSRGPAGTNFSAVDGTDRGREPSHPMAGPPTRQGGSAAIGGTSTRITKPYIGYEY